MPPKNNRKQQEMLTQEVKKIRKADSANLTCADCPRRATPYVCLTFSTFICQDCAGIHRKFNHRVKSISIATFTKDEVEKLREGGGNSVNNDKYMAAYRKGRDPFTLPQEKETDKIEQFIKYKYIEKKWYKENPTKKSKKKHKKKSKKKKRDSDSDYEDASDGSDKNSNHNRRSSRQGSRRNSRRSSQTQSPGTSQAVATKPTEPTIQEKPKQEAPMDDLLSFNAMDAQPATNQTQNNGNNNNGTDDFFGSSANTNANNGNTTGASGWDDPFAGPQASTQGNQSTNTGASDDFFGGDVFNSGGGNQSQGAPTQSTTMQSASNSNDLFGFGASQAAPVQTQPQVQPQAQMPQMHQQQNQSMTNLGFNNPNQLMMGGGMPAQQQYGGNMMMGGQPMGGMQPAQPQAQGSGFLNAINTFNMEAEAAKKKAEEEAAAKAKAEADAKAAAAAAAQGNAQPKKEEGDPFADLMGTIDLGGPQGQQNRGGTNNNSIQGTPVQSSMNPSMNPSMQPTQMGLGGAPQRPQSAQGQGQMYYGQNQFMAQPQAQPQYGMQQPMPNQGMNQYMPNQYMAQQPAQQMAQPMAQPMYNQGYMQSQAPAAQQWGGMVSQPPAQNTYGAPAAAASGSDNPFR